MQETFKFESCLVSPTRGELWRNGELFRLQPKVMEVLVYLAERSEEVVSKEELLENLWPGTYVTEYVLWRCIAQIRSALDDDSKNPRFIKTLSKRGYQFMVPVSRADDGELPRSIQATARLPRPVLVAASLVAASLVIALWVSAGSGESNPKEVQRHLETPQHLFQKGLAHYNSYTWADNVRAIQVLERASDLEPRNAKTLAVLADAYSMNWLRYSSEPSDRRWSLAALETASRAVAVEPRLPEAHKALGMAQSANGRLERAVAAYSRAVELRPDYASAVNNLAATYLSLGQLDKALSLQKQILRREQSNQRFACNLAHTYQLLGEFARADLLVLDALKLEPESPQCLAVRVRGTLVQGEIGQARRLARQALASHPRDSRLLELAAAAEQSAGDYRQALAYLRRATANSVPGGMSRSALRLSHVLWQMGDRDASSRIHREFWNSIDGALKQQDRQWIHLYWAAAIYSFRGELDQSVEWTRRAVENGFVDYGWVRYDPIFAEVVDDPQFATLLDELESRVAVMRREEAVL
jgi:DNA-binding winged helix-turn-helix (wHTH) protein/tetratricopeptide (TPR) repeat protein